MSLWLSRRGFPLLSLATAVALLASQACSVDVKIDDHRFACAKSAECGEGFFCGPARFCVSGSGPAQERPDAQGGTDAGEAPTDAGAAPTEDGGGALDASSPDVGQDPCARCSPTEPCDTATRTCRCNAQSCAGGFVCDVGSGRCQVVVGRKCKNGSDCGPGGICRIQSVSPFEFPNGYCTATCTPGGGECPAGSSCFETYGKLTSASHNCIKDCATPADCRAVEGYSCLPVNNGKLGCFPASQNQAGAAMGQPCAVNNDCLMNGQCLPTALGYPDGYCTIYSCAFGEPCQAGSICTGVSGEPWGRCSKTCVKTSDCRTGYHCVGLGYGAKLCLVTGSGSGMTTVGEACASSSDCNRLYCLSGFAGGYCSSLCSERAPCPTGSSCVEYVRAQGVWTFCLKDCSSSSECRSGYTCNSVSGSPFRGKCVPTSF